MWKKYRLEFYGLCVGLLAGWAYWYFIGCASGTCPISSSPVGSTMYGAVMGWLLFGLFKSENKSN